MKYVVKRFNELSVNELYELLKLRSEIFVVEQNCVYLDIDGKDSEALHILGKKEGEIIAYTRLFKKGERKFGYGHGLMRFSINTIQEKLNTSAIKIGAQTYLKKFYESHGFQQVGEGYIEDGIPHIHMIRS